MPRKNIPETEIHENAIISSLAYTPETTLESPAPKYIQADNLTFKPVFAPKYHKVRDLIRQTNEETLKYYSERNLTNPDSIRELIKKRKTQWEENKRFEYIISKKGNLVGKAYFELEENMTGSVMGIWLQKPYWGEEIAQKRADVFIHILFNIFDVSYLRVGAVIENRRSIKSIEKYIDRYGGSFYGFPPTVASRYTNNCQSIKGLTKHPEWMITYNHYENNNTGISTEFNQLDYNQINF